MLVMRIKNFITKPLAQKIVAIRFHTRRYLSKFPYVLLPVRLHISPTEKITFWGSRVNPRFDPDKGMFDYRDDDISELRFLYKFSRPGIVFIDIGAHHGIYTIIVAKKLGNNCRIVAFEPSPRDRNRLKLHSRLNCLSNVHVEPYAVSSQNGTAKFFLVLHGFTTMNSLRHPAVQDPIKEIMVDTVTLDQYCEEKAITQVGILKIDAEGAEMEIFKGASEVVSYHRPIIICEVSDWATQPWGYDARKIISYLKNYNYEWFEFQEEGTLSHHDEKDKYPDVKNYLAVPKEKLPLINGLIRQ